MFDRCYCKKPFCHLKTLEKFFEYLINMLPFMEGFVGFKNTCSRADLLHPDSTKLCSLLCTLLLMMSIFVSAQNAYT